MIIDEAHHALPERQRSGRPPLIDFIDCDLCNAGVPVALISTPQFGPRLAEFEDRTKWNARQFRRRFSGKWRASPSRTDRQDLVKLAKQVIPHAGEKGFKIAVAYADTFDRDVSGMFDLIRDARRRARKAGRENILHEDLKKAFKLDRIPSENAMAAAFNRSDTLPRRRKFQAAPELPAPCGTSAAELQPDRMPEISDDNPDHSLTVRDLMSA